jgi:hypothetical protein
MRKGVEITFQAQGGHALVEALANVAGERMSREIDIDWRIFHVQYGNEDFYRVLYTGKKVGLLHPLEDKRVREIFDETAHMERQELMKTFEIMRRKGFKPRTVVEVKEELDLWQDRLWDYI